MHLSKGVFKEYKIGNGPVMLGLVYFTLQVISGIGPFRFLYCLTFFLVLLSMFSTNNTCRCCSHKYLKRVFSFSAYLSTFYICSFVQFRSSSLKKTSESGRNVDLKLISTSEKSPKTDNF